jgi:hypothetical protein
MKIAVISMFANEEVIAASFAQQAMTLFDEASFIAHNSIDQTFEILSGFPVRLTRSTAPGYPQAQIMSKLMFEAFENGADYVVPLDFDEFLPFRNRDDFLSALNQAGAFDYLDVQWRNIFSAEFDSPIEARKFIYAHESSSVSKVIVSRRAFDKDPGLSLTQGNHGVLSLKDLVSTSAEWRLLHVPVQTPWQYAQKVINGSLAAVQQQKHDKSAFGSHWIDLSLYPFLDEMKLRGIALDYGAGSCDNHDIYFDETFTFENFGNVPYNNGSSATLKLLTNYWSDIAALNAGTTSSIDSGTTQQAQLLRVEIRELQRLLIASELKSLGLFRAAKRTILLMNRVKKLLS